MTAVTVAKRGAPSMIDLVTDPGIDFHESRTVELKGLDGLHRLFAIDLT